MNDRRQPVGPPPPHIIETEVHGDVSLYDPTREQVLVLNSTASDVWRLCDGDHDSDEIVSLLASAYQVEPDDLRGDVEQTIEQFVSEGFLSDR